MKLVLDTGLGAKVSIYFSFTHTKKKNQNQNIFLILANIFKRLSTIRMREIINDSSVLINVGF